MHVVANETVIQQFALSLYKTFEKGETANIFTLFT